MADSLGLPFEWTKFSGVAPIYPLADAVFLPKTYLPVQMDEPRYQELTRDALAGERVIGVSWQQQDWDPVVQAEPPFHTIGTIGYIEEFEFYGHGEVEILFNGLAKVRITELPTDKSYRHGSMELIEEAVERWEEPGEWRQLLRAFHRISDSMEEYFPLSEIQDARLSLETLVNLMATWLPIPLSEKQKLLEVNNIALRSKIVRAFLRQGELDAPTQDLSYFRSLENPSWN